MKNIWKAEDIVAGLYIIRESSPKGTKNLDFARTVTFKIGFTNHYFQKPEEDKRYGKISCLTDGWYCPIAKDKEEFAKYLNEDEYGYRPLSKEEYINMINNTNQGFY